MPKFKEYVGRVTDNEEKLFKVTGYHDGTVKIKTYKLSGGEHEISVTDEQALDLAYHLLGATRKFSTTEE